MIVAAGVISRSVSSWVLSNLGLKAVGGWRPARESNVSSRLAFGIGVFVSEIVHNCRMLSKDRSIAVITIDWLEGEEGEFRILKDDYSPSAEVGNR